MLMKNMIVKNISCNKGSWPGLQVAMGGPMLSEINLSPVVYVMFASLFVFLIHVLTLIYSGKGRREVCSDQINICLRIIQVLRVILLFAGEFPPY